MSTLVVEENTSRGDAPLRRLVSGIGAYVALTKPRIVELLVITAVPAMVLAHRGWPPLRTLLATLVGGSLAAGGANAMNNYFDRDIDERMQRTRRRPIPSHKVAPVHALIFGCLLGVAAFVFLWLATNLLAASLAIGALLFYVLVYTLGLKRRTPQNIVIGGAAGGFPALVAWAAVRGRLEAPAAVLFLTVFYWTPPHFWALAVKYRSDYRQAGVPMLPVDKGIAFTARQIVLYSWLCVATSLVLFAVSRLGYLYLVSASFLGVELLRRSYALRAASLQGIEEGLPEKEAISEPVEKRAMRLFSFSNAYLALLSVSIVLDVLVTRHP